MTFKNLGSNEDNLVTLEDNLFLKIPLTHGPFNFNSVKEITHQTLSEDLKKFTSEDSIPILFLSTSQIPGSAGPVVIEMNKEGFELYKRTLGDVEIYKEVYKSVYAELQKTGRISLKERELEKLEEELIEKITPRVSKQFEERGKEFCEFGIQDLIRYTLADSVLVEKDGMLFNPTFLPFYLKNFQQRLSWLKELEKPLDKEIRESSLLDLNLEDYGIWFEPVDSSGWHAPTTYKLVFEGEPVLLFTPNEVYLFPGKEKPASEACRRITEIIRSYKISKSLTPEELGKLEDIIRASALMEYTEDKLSFCYNTLKNSVPKLERRINKTEFFDKEKAENLKEKLSLFKKVLSVNSDENSWSELIKEIEEGKIEIVEEVGSSNQELLQKEVEKKIISELPNVKVEKVKRLKFIPFTKVVLNPCYEEFFCPLIEAYGKDTVYSALKNLEKKLDDFKEKTRLLRKLFERKEGINKKKRYALFALGILGASAALGTFYHFYSKPKEDEIKFVFEYSKKPLSSFQSSDQRDLSALFDYIQFLSANSTVLQTIDLNPGDEKYLAKGWYGIENLGYTNASWAGREAIVKVKVPEDAHFLRIRAGSIGWSDYLNWNASFKELMSHPNKMEVRLNDKLVDEIPLYSRMQIHYITLKPDVDSDGDRIINRYDINPRIPNPKPIKTDVNVGAYYLTGWGSLKGRSSDWSLGSPFNPILGNYTSDDPDVADWHIKCAVEHGVNLFICGYTKPYWGWEKNLEDGLLRAKFLPNIKFAVMFNNEPFWPRNPFGFDPSYLDKLTNETISYVAKNYFDHPSYFKISNRPFLMIFHASIYRDDIVGPEKFRSFINDIRDIVNKTGNSVYLVGDVMSTWIGDDENALNHAREVISPFDAISSYAILNAGERWEFDEKGNVHLIKPYDSMVKGYIELTKWWEDQAKKYSVKIIPPATTGFDNLIMYQKGIDNWLVRRVNSTPEKYKNMLEGIKPHIDPELRTVIVGAWNEYHEGWVIEPTKEFGFDYLKVIKGVLNF